MNDLKAKIAVALLCGILGLVVSMQFKTVQNTTGGALISTQRAQQLTMELRHLRSERESLNEELVALEIRLKQYEQSEADENLIIKNLKRDLDRYQIMAGYRAGQGSGIIITVDELYQENSISSERTFLIYNYDIILSLINKLNAAGAEAISINDQRYISTTEMFLSGRTVLVNSVPIQPPFVIKAIGNPDTLEAALNMRYGIAWQMRQDYYLQVNIRKESDIYMPRYNKVLEFEFARPIEQNQ